MPIDLEMRALLPCPFCGKYEARAEYIRVDEGCEWHRVHCVACGVALDGHNHCTEQEAVAAWNTRAALTPPAVPVDVAGRVIIEGVDVGSEQEVALDLMRLELVAAKAEADAQRMREALDRVDSILAEMGLLKIGVARSTITAALSPATSDKESGRG